MAEILLENIAEFEGDYGDDVLDFNSNLVQTTIVTGLDAVKSADKEYWVNGPLNYSIKIINQTTEIYSNITMTDYLDPNLIVLDEDHGVFIDGTATTYGYVDGNLSVMIPQVAVGGEVTVTFRVNLA